MFRKLIFIVLIAVLSVSLIPGERLFAVSEPIANPSAEQMSGSLPSGWGQGQWGESTAAFSVKNEGQDGSQSLYLEVSNYQSGDAKWYFKGVDVKPSTRYTFSDYYKSNVVSDITAEILTTSGTYEYVWLGSAEASSSYKPYSTSFTTPANAKSVSVFHLLARNGWLQTDAYSLHEAAATNEPAPVAPAPPQNAPANWLTNSWGSLTAAFATIDSAQAGSPLLETKVSNYQSGDAKWYQPHISVKPSTTYTYSDSYLADATSNVTVEVMTAAGTYAYYWLGDPAASSSLTNYRATFTTPADAKSMTVYHVMNKNGTLRITNASLKEAGTQPTPQPEPQPAPAGFNRPLISIQFDDGWKNAYTNGFPIVEQFGFQSTAFVITNTTAYPDYMSDADIKDLYRRGHTIGSHAVSHTSLPSLSQQQVTNELSRSQQYLQNLLGVPINELATPYCDSNAAVASLARQYYRSLRNCDGSSNKKQTFDAYNLDSRMVLKSTTDAELRSWIKEAKDTNSWLVLVYHEVTPNTNNDWTITPDNLRRQMQIIKDSGVTVKTSAEAFTETQTQVSP